MISMINLLRKALVPLLAAGVIVATISCQVPIGPRPMPPYQGGPVVQPRPPHQIPVSLPPGPTQPIPPPQPNPQQTAQVQFLSMVPLLIGADGITVRGSDRPLMPPYVNSLIKMPFPSRVAYRDVRVQFQPVQAFRNTPVRWQFKALGGKLRGSLPGGTPILSTPPGSRIPFNRLDANATTLVRISLPPIGLNRGQLSVTSIADSRVGSALEMVVPAVVVIDPGHGGSSNLAGSSFNNARSPSGVLEKTLALDYGRNLAQAVSQTFYSRGLPVQVALTRDRDINVTGRNRATLAKNLRADTFVTVHFNGFNGQARGTLQVQRNAAGGNVNLAEDNRLANRIVDSVVGAFKRFDPGAKKRNPVVLSTSVSNDKSLGNSAGHHPIRHAYLEMEFIDNPAVDHLLNGPYKHQVRSTTVVAMAQAIYDDIVNHRG